MIQKIDPDDGMGAAVWAIVLCLLGVMIVVCMCGCGLLERLPDIPDLPIPDQPTDEPDAPESEFPAEFVSASVNNCVDDPRTFKQTVNIGNVRVSRGRIDWDYLDGTENIQAAWSSTRSSGQFVGTLGGLIERGGKWHIVSLDSLWPKLNYQGTACLTSHGNLFRDEMKGYSMPHGTRFGLFVMGVNFPQYGNGGTHEISNVVWTRYP